ncbi:MAG: putative signal transducing protein [Anaerolineales bacterium]
MKSKKDEAPKWETMLVLHDPVQAEILKGMLEANGVQVLLSKEGAAKALGLSVGAMSEIELRVPSGQTEIAQELLRGQAGANELKDQG